MGQKAKYSLRADIFRFTPKTGNGWKPLSRPFRANNGHSLAARVSPRVLQFDRVGARRRAILKNGLP
jgi:hypothetical protein